MTYEGWSNYETWAVALWLDNDQGSQEAAEEIAQEAARGEEYPRARAGEALKDWLAEEMPDLGASVWADLLTAAFGEVDWWEIAEHFLDGVDGDEMRALANES